MLLAKIRSLFECPGGLKVAGTCFVQRWRNAAGVVILRVKKKPPQWFVEAFCGPDGTRVCCCWFLIISNLCFWFRCVYTFLCVWLLYELLYTYLILSWMVRVLNSLSIYFANIEFVNVHRIFFHLIKITFWILQFNYIHNGFNIFFIRICFRIVKCWISTLPKSKKYQKKQTGNKNFKNPKMKTSA